MQRPLVCDYLENHSLAQLREEYGVKVRIDSDGCRFSLNYDQVDAREGEPLSEQCRGLVLESCLSMVTDNPLTMDEIVDAIDVLAWPMNRFYMHTSGYASAVDWSDPGLKVQEKLDGTMIVVYYDPMAEQWCVATRMVPSADVPITPGDLSRPGLTFAQLFHEAFTNTTGFGEKFDRPCEQYFQEYADKNFNRRHTYVFELLSPWNRVVVKYDLPYVVLLAERDLDTGEEVLPVAGRLLRPREWPIRNMDDLLKFVDQADPTELEGAVVVDSKFRRVKVKSKAWLIAHHMKSTIAASPRNALEYVLRGTTPETLELLDESTRDYVERLDLGLKAYLGQVTERFWELHQKAAGSRKDFALSVEALKDWSTPYYELLRGDHETALDWARWAMGSGRLKPSGLDSLAQRIGLDAPEPVADEAASRTHPASPPPEPPPGIVSGPDPLG